MKTPPNSTQSTVKNTFTRISLQHRHAVWALAIAVALFGSVAYLKMPVQLFPDTAPPIVNIVTVWPGASAEDVAEDLARPMEEAFASLEGIVRVKSRAQDNLARVTLEFNYDRKVELAAVDVQNALARIRSTLPAAIAEPQVLQFSTNDRPVIAIGVGATSLSTARRQAEDVLAARLQRVAGVAGVDVYGGARDAVLIEFVPERLAATGMTLRQVAALIRAQNLNLPAGDLRLERSRSSLRLEARVASVDALAKLPLPAGPGKRVLLGDIATVRRGQLDDEASFAIDGKRAIAMAVYKTSTANTVAVVEAVTAEVERLKVEFPAFELRIGEESGSFAATSIGNLIANVWQALALASLLIFLFLGKFRASLVVALSMPLAYGLTFGLMHAFGIEFNMVTLSAIILAVGMVVDAAVVVLENITRIRDEEGVSMFEAAVRGTDEVVLPVLGGVATTVIVLVPLLDLDGFIGKTFGPLALTLLLAFTSSAAVALVLLPTLSLWLDGESRLDDWSERITAPFRWTVDLARRTYLWALKWALRGRIITLVFALVAMVVGLIMIKDQGMSVLPQMDSGSFFVSIQTSPGTSLQETRRIVAQVERAVAAQPEVLRVQSQVGFEPGMRSASSTGAEGPTQGFISATLTDRTTRATSIWDVEDRVRQAIARVPGIQSSTVRELGNTAKPTTTAPIVVKLTGDDPLILDRLAETVLTKLTAVDGVLEPVRAWRLDQKRDAVKVDRGRAASVGLVPAAIAAALNAGTRGVSAGALYDATGGTTPMRLRYDRRDSAVAADLLRFPIKTPSGLSVPLRTIAHLEPAVGQALVTREDLSPSLEVSAFAAGRALSFILADIEETFKDMPLPTGYQLEISGEKRDLNEARGQLLAALAISILAVYLLLVALLGSFVHPMTILMSVPLSLSGVGIALKLADKPVSMPVMIGLILLVGTVVNNAIILIDFIRARRAAGATRHDAVVASVSTRFRPIMMTSLSTIIGMIPLAAEWALGAERFSPLAIAVIGGMSVATLLTLIVIPVLYDLIDDATVRLGSLLRSGQTSRVAALLLLAVLSAASVILAPKLGFAAHMTSETPAKPSSPLVLVAKTAASRVQTKSPRAMHTLAVRGAGLSVADAIHLAERSSPTLAGARHTVHGAKALQASARARRLPSLDLDARYSRLSYVVAPSVKLPLVIPGLPPPEPMNLGESIRNMWNFRASVTQPIYLGGALLAGERAAVVGTALRQAQVQQVRADLALEVTRAWWAVRRLLYKVRISRRAVSTLQTRLQVVRHLQDGGRARPLDVQEVEARMAEARRIQVEVDGNLENAEAALRSLTGMKSTAAVRLGKARSTVVSGGSSSSSGNAPELRVARLAERVQRHRSTAASAARFPKLLLKAGATLANPNTRYFPVKAEFNTTWDVSIVAQWRAWDWGAAKHNARASQATTQAAAARYREVERRMALAHNVAARRITTTRTVARLMATQVAARRAALAVSRDALASGRATHADVAQAVLALAQTESAAVDAKIDIHLAVAQLIRVGGNVANARP